MLASAVRERQSKAHSLRDAPQHGLHHGVQGDLDIQLVSTRKLHVDCPVPGDDVASVVGTFYPDCVLIHDVSAVGLQAKGSESIKAGTEVSACLPNPRTKVEKSLPFIHTSDANINQYGASFSIY